MKFNLQKILSNKILLYVVFGLSIIQLLHFLFLNRFDYIIVFGLISYLVYYFRKNMILVLGIPLIIVTIQLWLFKEGFETEIESSSNSSSTNKANSSGSTNKTKVSIPKPKSSSPSGIIQPISEETQEEHNEEENTNEEREPSSTHDDNNEAEFNPNQINYATTMTDNLKMYNSVLGSDGFAKMTNDTQELLRQQEMLSRNMQQFAPMIQQMTPFLEKATQLLNGVDMGQLNAATNIFKRS
jgi:hypothetical protein